MPFDIAFNGGLTIVLVGIDTGVLCALAASAGAKASAKPETARRIDRTLMIVSL
jgi:hypothetical protein